MAKFYGNKTEKTVEIGSLSIAVAFLWACVIGIIWTSYWSFEQTWKFIETGNPGWQSFYMALCIQYLQNVFVIAAILKKDDFYEVNPTLKIRIRDLMFFGWFVCAFIDAGTNVGQWVVENPLYSTSFNVHSITWIPICIAVVFVEELMGLTFGVALHETGKLWNLFGFGDEQKSSVSASSPRMFSERQSKPDDSLDLSDLFGGGKEKPKKTPGRKPKKKDETISGLFGGKGKSKDKSSDSSELPDDLLKLLGE